MHEKLSSQVNIVETHVMSWFWSDQGGIILHCFESVLVQNIGSEVAGTPPLQVNYLFHTSLRLFRLGIYALFILALT